MVAWAALSALAMVSCTGTAAAGSNAQPADIYAAGLSVTDVRSLFGDQNWWPAPPTFEVRPLDSDNIPPAERFSIMQRFIHVGSAEEWLVRYTVYDKVSDATAQMTSLVNDLGPSPTSPKVGDQVLYYGLFNGGAAPFITRTFVRLGQIVVEIAWSRKDGIPTVDQLGRNANKVISNLKNVLAGKVHPSPQAADQKLLPPPGLDVTLLGSTELPIEAWTTMASIALPSAVAALLHGKGVDNFVYGDYALNVDTRMEVQVALLRFGSNTDAVDWANTFAPGTPDQSGVASAYIDSVGQYQYMFVSGSDGGMLVCKSIAPTEAASRACEAPLERTALAWKLSLGGLS